MTRYLKADTGARTGFVPIYCAKACLRDWPRLPSKQTNQAQRATAGQVYARFVYAGRSEKGWYCLCCGSKVLISC